MDKDPSHITVDKPFTIIAILPRKRNLVLYLSIEFS